MRRDRVVRVALVVAMAVVIFVIGGLSHAAHTRWELRLEWAEVSREYLMASEDHRRAVDRLDELGAECEHPTPVFPKEEGN